MIAHTICGNKTDYSTSIDISNPEATEFVYNLYSEFGKFFRELGCMSFEICADELLGFGDGNVIDNTIPKWQNLEHWDAYAKKVTGNPNAVAYDAFIIYINNLTNLLRALGYTSVRMWNDNVYRTVDTGWTGVTELDKSVGIEYWFPHTNEGRNTAKFYVDQGHDVYNYARLYTYYTLYPNGKAPSFTTPEAIMDEWNPYVFTPNTDTPEDNTYIFVPKRPGNFIDAPNEKVKGAGFCLWCDTPAAETEDEIIEHIRPYFTAIAKKSTGNAPTGDAQG